MSAWTGSRSERVRAVGRSRSTCEPAEQGCGCGGGGGKGGGQGEHGQQTTPRTQRRARRVRRAGSCAAGGSSGYGGTVHGAVAPCRPGPAPDRNGCGQLDGPVVPANLPNKAAAAEAGEERGAAKGNTASKPRPGHSAGPGVSGALDRVRQVAVRATEARFTALLPHVGLDRLQIGTGAGSWTVP